MVTGPIVGVLAAWTVAAAPAGPAGPAGPAEDGELAGRCDELARRHGLSGVLLVARGDEVLAERSYGLADLDAGLPNGPDTRFLVASLTKPVVAFTTLRLVDEGRLALDDTAGAHVAELVDTPAGRATVHQLLSHTSGLPHYEGWPGFLADVERPRSDDDLLDLLAHTALAGEPGEHVYSGPGYLLLGLVLERAAGEALSALVAGRVTGPLGMTATRLLDPDDVSAPHARPYVRGAEGPAPAPFRHPSTLRATGGLVTTARDLHRFARAVQRGDLLSEPSRATLVRAVDDNYACGLIVYAHPLTRRRFARHLGGMPGVAAHFVLGLDDERVCIALANVTPARVDDLDDGLMALVPAAPPEERAERGQ